MSGSSCKGCEAKLAEVAALREDPRLRIPLDGPGSHRQDLAELRTVQEEAAFRLKLAKAALAERDAAWRKLAQARALLAQVKKELEPIAEGRSSDPAYAEAAYKMIVDAGV